MREIATSCGGALLSQAPASAVSMSSITVKSAASALSEIWTRTVARVGSLVKLTWRWACQERVAIWTDVPAISMQGRGPGQKLAAGEQGGNGQRNNRGQDLQTQHDTLLAHHKPATGGLWLAEGKEN